MSGASPVTGTPFRLGGRLATIAVIAVTVVIIAVAAWAIDQPTADGTTGVDLSGAVAAAAPQVGEAPPAFTATLVDGTPVDIAQFAGQPVWLTFGASWCQPCRAENPDIKATAEKYAASGLVVLAVFISEDDAAVKDYADRIGLGYLKVADPGTDIASEYRILGIPSHYFIDSNGVLQSMRIGSLDIAGMETALEAIR